MPKQRRGLQFQSKFFKKTKNYKSVWDTVKWEHRDSSITAADGEVIFEMNDVEAYFAYVKTLEGYGDVNMAEKDSLLYASGENLYISGNCNRASEVFRSYLNEFRNGSFRLNAQFYLAECLNSSGNSDEALALYQEVIKIPNNQFMEHVRQRKNKT